MTEVPKPLNVAVVGSGIAGLACAWALSLRHRVTIYELHAGLGMDAEAATLNVNGRELRVDVPMRVFFPAYYPLISRLYEHLGIQSDEINYAASFSGLQDGFFFQYTNYPIGRRRIPFLTPSGFFSGSAVGIGIDFLRFNRAMSVDRNRLDLDTMTLGEYLQRTGVSKAFSDRFLIPAYAGIATCSYESVRRYPASIIVDFLKCGLLTTGMRRVRLGTGQVVSKLSANVQDIRLGTPVSAVVRNEQSVRVSAAGVSDTYDHVIFATQANHTRRLLSDITDREDRILAHFRYERNDVVMHTDPRLAPRKKKWWSPVNYVLKEGATCPMATIWMNGVHAAMDIDQPVFQTWHPYMDPDPGTLISRASFERPVVDPDSLKALDNLAALQEEDNRRVWFCGSYAYRGIPLLESAAVSGILAAKRLGCPLPFEETDDLTAASAFSPAESAA
ncbi:MAG: NAD(P)-binding protein [Acidobacteriota bacterium]|nr:NAD(P)-binding protein [Acidobacteriota bacterium]